MKRTRDACFQFQITWPQPSGLNLIEIISQIGEWKIMGLFSAAY